MAKIRIYGSSFDPITNVHLWTASTVAHRKKLDKVIFLPCSNKRKDKRMKTSDEHRWNMIQMAIKDNPVFEADDFEMLREAWQLTTYETLKHFKEKYKEDDFYFIMGADLLIDIGEGKWGNASALVKENKFIVMARDGIDMVKTISKYPILRNNDADDTFSLLDKGLAMEISSTYIRQEFSMDGEPRYLLPEPCYQYCKQHYLYKNN